MKVTYNYSSGTHWVLIVPELVNPLMVEDSSHVINLDSLLDVLLYLQPNAELNDWKKRSVHINNNMWFITSEILWLSKWNLLYE